jgi:iron complex transport system substrate-binding protein
MEMKMEKWIFASFLLILVLAGVPLSGCLDETTAEGGLSLEDQTGNFLELNGIPGRIVTLTPALTEIVLELECGEKLVGGDSVSVSENPDMEMTAVSTWEGLDTEKLVSLSPDLVIMDRTLDITDSNYDAISDLSIPVYRAFPEGFLDVIDLISDIGAILERTEKADDITEDMMERYLEITNVTSEINSEDRPVVIYVTYYDGESDPWVGTSSAFSADLIDKAGGRIPIEDDSGVVVQVSVETLIGADPDVIITSQSGSWPTPSRDTIISDDTWSDISAVKKEKVIDIDGDLIDRTGPFLIDGLEAIYEVLQQ